MNNADFTPHGAGYLATFHFPPIHSWDNNRLTEGLATMY